MTDNINQRVYKFLANKLLYLRNQAIITMWS